MMTRARDIIGENASADVTLGYGVHQGSVLGPKMYSPYTPHYKASQIRPALFYDDTQLYVYFKNNDRERCVAAIIRLNDKFCYIFKTQL